MLQCPTVSLSIALDVFTTACNSSLVNVTLINIWTNRDWAKPFLPIVESRGEVMLNFHEPKVLSARESEFIEFYRISKREITYLYVFYPRHFS